MVDVVLTEPAQSLLERIRARRAGPLTMVIGNGCCDSTAPFVFEHHFAGPNECPVATLAGGVPVLLDAELVPLFEGREVIIDVAEDPAADSFSCESELGMRFRLQRLPGLAGVQSS